MDNLIEGEEIDTKHMIQAQKYQHFYVTKPYDASQESRKDDEEYLEQLKQVDTLGLVDYDVGNGTLYIGKYLSSKW